MNLRHATAFALVGWYLMTPPAQSHPLFKGDDLDTAAPLSKWTLWGSYDSAKECDAGRTEQIKTAAPHLAFEILEAECIATDDPRLKEK
jgi:hypothetical protein